MQFNGLNSSLFIFILFTLLSCSSAQNKSSPKVDAKTFYSKIDTTHTEEMSEPDFRKEFIATYLKPISIDTSFINNGKNYRVLFRHFCTMDSGLRVPAKYNFDTKKDFVTHNFISKMVLFSNKDTLFKKQITKAMFDNLLDTSLKNYATLLYPNFYIKNDSIEIDYSISIPVTDIGVGVQIKFDKKGNYTIRE